MDQSTIRQQGDTGYIRGIQGEYGGYGGIQGIWGNTVKYRGVRGITLDIIGMARAKFQASLKATMYT